MEQKVWVLKRDGEFVAAYSTWVLANSAKYSGVYGEHWDSFEIEESEFDPRIIL